MHPLREEQLRHQTRRQFLAGAGQFSLGAIALEALAQNSVQAAPAAAVDPLAPRLPPQAAKAKRVIYLHMSGGPPNLDIFDGKPELVKHSGEPCPDSFLKGRTFAFTTGVPKLMGSPRTFKKYGEAGILMSDAVPNFHGLADDITLIRSLHTDQFNHAPAELLLFTGHPRQGRPSMGSWVTYGLGSENQNLPGYVVLISSGVQPSGGQGCWGSGFIPSVYQGVQCRSQGDPVLFASDPPGMSRDLRRTTLDALRTLNERQHAELGHPETMTRIAQYELAFRMQTAVPQVMDISKEPATVHEEYGTEPGKVSFANNCLLARRLVENGVRFVQLYDWGWDHHGTSRRDDIRYGLAPHAQAVDKPLKALIQDLKRRGLLDQTLVVFGGEFGRTPMRENRNGVEGQFIGRDHHPYAFTMVMAGGGFKRGLNYGESDDIGYYVTRHPMTPRDLQATILHQLGLDPYRLHYPYQGLNQRLIGPTDEGRVMKDLLI